MIGFGNVGQALASILVDHGNRLERDYGVRFEITAVADITGGVVSTDPLPPERLLETMKAAGGICHYPGLGVPGMSGLDLVQRAQADILVEASPTNVVDGEPGLTHIKTALNRGMHVVTANKGPLVVAFAELRDLARSRGLKLMYGPATAAALPTVSVGMYELAGSQVTKIEGILNGTTNFIITRMRDLGVTYQEALQEAQRLGIAETNPTLDVEGYDTANKLLILANTLMGGSLRLSDVEREGITQLSVERVQAAYAGGKAIKLIGAAQWEKGRLRAVVRPTELNADHPLAKVDGTEKGVTFHSDLLGTLTVTGGASGRIPAAASILRDLLNLVREARLV
ncbi:MAG: homoserine dehydrogenase [Chloroflexota bacterium]